MNKLSSFIKWSQETPKKDGVYYVLGEGINGVQQRVLSDGAWKLKDGEIPVVYGVLDGYKAGVKSVFVVEAVYDKDSLEKLYPGSSKAFNLVANDGEKDKIYANILLKGDKKVVAWLLPDEVLSENLVDDFKDLAINEPPIEGYLISKVSKPSPEPKKPVKKEAKVDELKPTKKEKEVEVDKVEKLVEEKKPEQEEIVQEEAPTSEPSGTEAVPTETTPEEWGDDTFDMDDLPF